MTTLFESLLLTIIHDIFSLLILTYWLLVRLENPFLTVYMNSHYCQSFFDSRKCNMSLYPTRWTLSNGMNHLTCPLYPKCVKETLGCVYLTISTSTSHPSSLPLSLFSPLSRWWHTDSTPWMWSQATSNFSPIVDLNLFLCVWENFGVEVDQWHICFNFLFCSQTI